MLPGKRFEYVKVFSQLLVDSISEEIAALQLIVFKLFVSLVATAWSIG